jgi:calpain-15
MADEEKGEKAICEAKGYPCYLNCLCAPFVLCYQSSKIYCCACVFTYVYRLLVTLFCCICRTVCPSCYRYTDKKFPANAKSIGAWKDKSEADVGKEIEWQRAVTYFESKLTAEQSKEGVRVKLFEDGVEPKDVAQGGLGDCWLISALACMSEHEGLLRTIFKTQEFNERGKYSVRLYDGRAKKWTVVTVDDNLPLLKGSTSLLFAQPKGQELWVVLIEKAFAKFCGNYVSLDGGNEIWAFEALTGDPVHCLLRKPEGWIRHDLAHMEGAIRKIGLRKVEKEVYTDDETFGLLRTYIKQKALLTASIASDGEQKDKDTGLVAGHAYSILDAKRFDKVSLLKLRNPWGSFEWKGAWSDNAPEWDKNPKIKKLCQHVSADDGTFWISLEDFIVQFNNVDVCQRSKGLHDLYIDLHEGDGCLRHCSGPIKGCSWGCCKFWCMCKGARCLYGHTPPTGKSAEIDSGNDDTLLDQVGATMARA